MKVIKAGLLLAVAGGVLSGCAIKSISHGTAITQADATAKLVIGRTTKQDVFLNFGEPTKVMNNEKVFFYSWTRGKKVAIMGIGSGNAKADTLVVVFDEKDIVKNYRFARGDVGGQVED